MRIAIVHDYLAQGGGAERVVEAMHAVWPEAPIFTSVYDPEATFSSFQTMDIRTSFLQRFPFARNSRFHKVALPLYPLAFEHFDFSEYDVVLSSSSGFAKGVITGPETCHISYCHTPARFAWRYHEYVTRGGYGKQVRKTLPFIVHFLRAWDYACAQNRVDYFLANSRNIARRIRKHYGRGSDILYPPVDVHRFLVAEKPSADFLLVVSRLLSYKRVDLAVAACTRLNLPLKVVGTGPDLARLKSMAGPSVEFLGRLPDSEVTRLMSNCRAFLFPGEEDFGIAPVEAMASGRPVIALRAGGALETVIEGETGLFFDEPEVDSLVETLRRLEDLPDVPERMRAHALTFDVSVFQARLRRYVEMMWQEHRERYNNIGCEDELIRQEASLSPPSRMRESEDREAALLAARSAADELRLEHHPLGKK
jgi:Glycosyltransferase